MAENEIPPARAVTRDKLPSVVIDDIMAGILFISIPNIRFNWC